MNLAQFANANRDWGKNTKDPKRLKWLNDDGNEGKYKIAMSKRPEHQKCIETNKATRIQKSLRDQYRTKNDI